MHQSFLNNGWQGIIWAMETENRSFSLTGRQLLELRTVRYLMLRGEAQWGNPGPRRARAGFISPDITKNGPKHHSCASVLKLERCSPTFSLNVNSSIIAFLYLKRRWHYIAVLLVIFLDPFLHPLLVFYIFFLHSSFFLLVTLIEGLIDKEKIDF